LEGVDLERGHLFVPETKWVSGSRSYDFGIYNYNASVVTGWSVFRGRRRCFWFSKRTRLLVAV
jgi:hypothetical protein